MVYIHLSKEHIEEPIFIYGVGGGMGNVAKLVGRELIKTYNAKKIGFIISKGYSDVVIANKNGILKMLGLFLYHFNFNNQDFIILYGDLQPNVSPIDIPERYEISNQILKLAKKFNTQLIISLGGYGVEIEPESPKVYIAANNKKILEELKEKLGEDFNLYSYSNIVGLSGLLVAMAKYYSIPAYIMLVETYPTAALYGYFGAKKLLEILSKLYGFQFDLDKYEKKGKKFVDMIKNKLYPKEVKQEKEKDKKAYYFG